MPDIIINGRSLTNGEAMVLRYAVEMLAKRTTEDPLELIRQLSEDPIVKVGRDEIGEISGAYLEYLLAALRGAIDLAPIPGTHYAVGRAVGVTST